MSDTGHASGGAAAGHATLQQLLAGLQAQATGGAVTLDRSFLAGAALALLHSDLGLANQAVTLTAPSTATLSIADDANGTPTLFIEGALTPSDPTLAYLGLLATPVNVAIQQTTAGSATGYDLVIATTLPLGWTFGDSFAPLGGLMDPAWLHTPNGQYLYFSSFTASRAVPLFPGETAPDTPAGDVLATGLTYFADIGLAGIFGLAETILGIGGTLPVYGAIAAPTSDEPMLDLRATATDKPLTVGFLNLTVPWIGVRTTYVSETDPTLPRTSAQALGDSGTTYPTLFFYIGTIVAVAPGTGSDPVQIEIDLIFTDPASPHVLLTIGAPPGDQLSLGSVAGLLLNTSAATMRSTVGTTLARNLDDIKLVQFDAMFVPGAARPLQYVQASLSTQPPWQLGIGSWTLDLNLKWATYFFAPTTTWNAVFDAILTVGPTLAFEVSVTVPEPISIVGTEHGSATLALSDLNAILPGSLNIPTDLLTMTLSDFSVAIDYGTKAWSITGEVSAAFALFGTPVLALRDMQVSFAQTSAGYAATFDGTVVLGTIQVQTTATISDRQGVDTVFTLHLIDETVGSMLNHLVHLVDPDYDVDFGSPWNDILDIGLDALVVQVNVTQGSVSLAYTAHASLAFITIDTISLTYTRGTGAASGVRVAIAGSFFGQEFGPGKANAPMSWDALNGSPPAIPSAGASIFDLRYLGLGQHIAVSPTDLTTVEQVMQALQASVLPSPAGALPAFGQNALSFSAQSNWLIGAEFTVMDTLSLSAIFNDPDLYGILIQLSGDKAKIFKGLKFEILYRKVTDTIGVYHIELALPDAMRHLEFGEVSVTLPLVVLDIYTNGNFRVDLGFPVGLDFSNAFCLQIFPFVGYGGFYFALLDGATSSRVPAITNGSWSPVIEFGVGLSVGVGKTVDEGILSGGISVTVVGIVQGVLAWFNPSDDSAEETFYWVQGTIAITGKLYATIDFAIIQASVDVTAYASVTLTIESHMPILIELSAGVSVRVSVHVVFFTIHLSFSATIDASFTIGAQTPTPWILADRASAGLRAGATAARPQLLGQGTLHAQAGRSQQHHRLMRRALRRSLPSATPPSYTSWPATLVLPQLETVTLWITPAFTAPQNAAGSAETVILLTLANTISATAKTPAEHAMLAGDAPASAPFNLLMQAMLLWGIDVVTSGGTTVAADQLADLQQALQGDPATQAAAFDYATLTAFLARNFVFDLQTAATVASETGASETGVAFFPMIPELTLSDTQSLAVDFGTFNAVDDSYQAKIRAYFKMLQVQYQARAPAGGGVQAQAAAAPVSMATIVFSQYFAMLLSAGLKAAIDLLASYPYTTGGDAMSVADVGTAIGDATLATEPLRIVSPIQDLPVLAGGASFVLRHVLHQVRAGESFASVATALAALGARNLAGAAYGAGDAIAANTVTPNLFNSGTRITVDGIGYTTQQNDTLNLVAARMAMRAGGPTVLNAVTGLAAAVQALQLANPALTDPNAVLPASTAVTLPGGGTYRCAPNLMNATGPSGDTLMLIAAYALAPAQGLIDLAGAVAALLLANPGLPQTDPTVAQPAGTAIVIPPSGYAIAGGDTIAGIATRLMTTVAIVEAALLAVPAATQLLSPLGVLATPLRYPAKATDTFSGIAGTFGLTLHAVAEAAAATPGLFAPATALTVLDVPRIAVATLTAALLEQGEWNNASGMVSRFLLGGLRLPDPNDATFAALTLAELDDPAKLGGIVTAPIYALIGQQYPLADPPPAGYEITLTNRSGAGWLSVPAPFALSADERALLHDMASTALDPQVVSLARLALFRMTPPRIALQNMIPWQAAVSPAGCLARATVGNPAVWLFSDALVARLAAAPAGETLLYELVVAKNAAPDAPVAAAQAACYAWATIVDITIALPATDGPSQATANSYVIGGADDVGAALLQQLHAAVGDTNTPSLYLLYPPNPTGGQSSGMASDQVDQTGTFILKTNLSTLTHSGGHDFALFATADPTGTYAAPLSDAKSFLALLWEASITRSGGFYLTYANANGGAALPPSIFGNAASATISLLVVFDTQAQSRDAPIRPYHNCAIVGGDVDTSAATLFVQPATYSVQAGDSLTTALQRINTMWNSGLKVAGLAAANQAVPQLLRVGATMATPSGTGYTIAYGDTLASIAAALSTDLPTLLDATLNGTSNTALALLAAGAPMQFAAGVLSPATTAPPGTVGFELVRANPNPDNLPYGQLTPAQLIAEQFNMVGFGIAAAGVFTQSGAGLPTMPSQSPRPAASGIGVDDPGDQTAPDWSYTQALTVAPYGGPYHAGTSAALPPAEWSPYNGIGYDSASRSVNAVTLALNLQDIYGNIQPLPAGYTTLQVPVGYFDAIVGLQSWPSLAMTYAVGGVPATPTLSLAMRMQQSRYVPSRSVTVASALAAIAADLQSYRTIYYQLAQPDVTFALRTSLSASRAGSTSYPLAAPLFSSFATGALVYLSALATLEAVSASVTGSTTTIGDLAGQYGVTAAELLTANRNTLYASLFGEAVLAVPLTYATTSGDTLDTIAAKNTAATLAQLVTFNALVALDPGTELTTPARTATASATDSLAAVAQAATASAAAIALANAARGILVGGVVLTVGVASYTTIAGDSFANAAGKLGATVAATAIANQFRDGIFIGGTALDVTDVVVSAGDTLTSLAATCAGGDLQSLAAANAGVADLFASGTALQTGWKTSPSLDSADTLSTFAQNNGVTPAQLGGGNAAATFAAGAAVAIPNALAQQAGATQYCTYTAAAGDTLDLIAAKFATTAAAIAALNPAMPATVAPQGLWICPPMLGAANGRNGTGTLDGLATAYNTDAVTLATSNAAAIGFLAPNVTLPLGSPAITTSIFETFNSVLARLAEQDPRTTVTTIAQLAAALGAVHGLVAADAVVVPVPPPSPANIVALTPAFVDPVFAIVVDVVIARDATWIDPDFVATPAVASVTCAIAPDTRGDGGTLSLGAFAAALQTALPGLQVATGDPGAEGDSPSTSAIWGVNFGSPHGPEITYQFSTGAHARFFALPPLSTSLLAGTLQIRPYTSGQPLGAPAAQTFQGVDLDVWLNAFLGAIDTFLAPSYAVPAYAIDPQNDAARNCAVEVVTAKQSLATTLSGLVAHVLDDQSGGSLDDARAALYQALLTRLSSAFTIDTIVQVPVTVGSPFGDVTVAPRLSGTIVMGDRKDVTAGAPDSFSFSTAKVAMTSPGATGTFLFSVKSPAQNRSVTLDIDYSIAEMELPDPNSVIGDYEGSSWLKFVTPLDGAGSRIGTVAIPIPLRSYPSPVALVSQRAAQSITRPETWTPADLLGWDLDFVYNHDDAEQDTPLVAVTFNGGAVGGASQANASFQIELVFAALAQFTAVYPALKDDLALLPLIAPGTSSKTALNAAQVFAQLVTAVAAAFRQTAKAMTVVPPSLTYGYRLQKNQTKDLDATLTTLTVTSVDPTTNTVRANPTALWPTVTLTYDGSSSVLVPLGAPGATAAVYTYPAGIPADAALNQFFAFKWVGGTQTQSTWPGSSVAGAQSFSFQGIDILTAQSARAGVSILRNLVLIDGVVTNRPFVYQTPLSSFSSAAIPSNLVTDTIPIGAAPTPIAAALGTFLDGVVGGDGTTWQAGDTLPIRFTAGYSYTVSSTSEDGTDQALAIVVPIMLIPSYAFDPGSDANPNVATSFVRQVQSALDYWASQNTPAQQNAAFVFDVLFYATQGELQPLIEAASLAYAMTATSR